MLLEDLTPGQLVATKDRPFRIGMYITSIQRLNPKFSDWRIIGQPPVWQLYHVVLIGEQEIELEDFMITTYMEIE